MAASSALLNQRGSPRRKLFQPGQVWAAAAPHRVHLLDLSLTGALAYADPAPAVGSIVRLACPMPLGAARVVWTRGKRFGLAFSQPISAALLDAILAGQPMLGHREPLVIR